MDCCGGGMAYGTYPILKNLGNLIIQYLVLNNENIWKLLKFPTPDALEKPNLSRREKSELIHEGMKDTSEYRVFRSPYLDDLQDYECSQLRIYVEGLNPENRVLGLIDVNFELIIHSKLVNLNGYMNRLEVMLFEVIDCLNGANVQSLGQLAFDRTLSVYDLAKMNLFNNRNFYGYTLTMSVRAGEVKNPCQ